MTQPLELRRLESKNMHVNGETMHTTYPEALVAEDRPPSATPHSLTAAGMDLGPDCSQEHATAIIVQLLEMNSELAVTARESLRIARALERTVARLQEEAAARREEAPTRDQAGEAAVEPT